MSAQELLYGSAAAGDLARPTHALAGAAPEPAVLSDVEIAYALFELPMASVLPRLPSSLHPSIPAVVATSFWRAPQSPFGPFHFAYVGIACRTGIKPRHFVYAAWCDNPKMAQRLSESYGVHAAAAAIVCRESYDRIRAAVQVDGNTVLEVLTTQTTPIVGGGGAVKYSPALNCCVVDGEPRLVQFEANYAFKRVLRGPATATVFDAAALGEPGIAPAYPIAGTFAVCDVELLPARFSVDLRVPAEQGGATKIERR